MQKIGKVVNIITATIVTVIFCILAGITMFGIAGCGTTPQEPIQELCGENVGAYFITDESYEQYVRACAAQAGVDEQWISDVLQGGDGGDLHDLIRPQSWFWCVIAGNQITVSEIYNTVYDISADGTGFRGESAIKTVSFWFEGDVLHLQDNNRTAEYKKDNSYQRDVTKDVRLGAPKNIDTDCGENSIYVTFRWEYQSEYGTVGAAVQIKTPHAKEYETVNPIERVYGNTLVIEIQKSKLETGENSVRIYHIGGPSITNDHSILVQKNSPYATYRVIVEKNGKIRVKTR